MAEEIINGLLIAANSPIDVPAYIGDPAQVAAGNYLEIQEDGSVLAHGNATMWRDINLGSAVLTLAAGNNPTKDEFKSSDGSDIGVTTFSFGVGDYVSGSVELQHDYYEGTDLYFHVHWQGIAAPSGSDFVNWQITYSVAEGDGDGAVLPVATVISKETMIDTQYGFYTTYFDAIDGSLFDIGDQVLFQLQRIASVGDAYSGGALIATIGIHYQVNSWGSRTTLAK